MNTATSTTRTCLWLRIAEFDGGFTLGLYYRDAEEPTAAGDFTSERDLFVAVDKAVEGSRKEVGPI